LVNGDPSPAPGGRGLPARLQRRVGGRTEQRKEPARGGLRGDQGL